MGEKLNGAIRERCHRLGLTKVRELLEIPGNFDVFEAPIVRAWIKEEEYKQRIKITLKDCIGWVLLIISLIINIILAFRRK